MIYLFILLLAYVIYLHWYILKMTKFVIKTSKDDLDLHEMINKEFFMIQDQFKGLKNDK